MGIDLLGTQRAIVFALLFVTLPFVVRSGAAGAAGARPRGRTGGACLGAAPLTIFRRIVLPLLLPAIASGAALGLRPRDGRVRLGAADLRRTEPHHGRVDVCYPDSIQNFDYAGAAAIATVLLVVSLIVIVALDVVQRRAARRG